MNQSLNQATTMYPSLFKRAQEMSNGKTTAELETIARNICTTKGIQYEEALNQFKQMWGG